MKTGRILGALLAAALFASPLQAKNFAVPEKNPAITITLPDSWETEEIEYGFQARPEDEAIFLSIESAASNEIEKMIGAADKWMRDNKIKPVKPVEAETKLNGIDCKVFQFQTSDENGPTTVDLILLPAGGGRVMMVTVWGNDEERATHGKALDGIFSSIKAIN